MNPPINNVITTLNSLGDRFCDYAGSMLIQSGIMIVLLLFIDLLIRKRVRATLRYWIWMLVFIKLILPPSLSLPTGLGYWRGDFLSTALPVSEQESTAIQHETTGALAHEETPLSTEARPIQPPQIIPEPAVPATSAVLQLDDLAWRAGVFILWLIGVLVFSALLIQRMLYVRRLIAKSESPENRFTEILNGCCKQIHIRRPIELRLSNNVSSPAVCGFIKPVILMPTALIEKLPPDRLRAVLIHELAHIKRGDLWINSAQTILLIVYFYNPLVWLVNVIVRRIREQAVDEMVLATLGTRAKDYSNTLIDIAEMTFFNTSLSLRLIGVVESKKALQGRIRHMLNRPIPKSAKMGILGVMTIMIIAAALLPMAKAQKLKEANASAIAENKKETSQLLNHAAANGDIKAIKKFISSGVDINTKDEDGKTPLHCAAENGHKDVVKLLIAKGADINAWDNNKETPADTAIPPLTIVARNQLGQKKRIDVLKLLVGKGAQIPTIHLAAFIGDMEKLKIFLEQGIDVNARDKDGRTPLHLASMSGQKEIVRFLIGRSADVNAQTTMFDLRPIHAAAMSLNLEVVRLLIDNGSHVDTRPFRLAINATMIRMMERYSDLDTPNLDAEDIDALYAKFLEMHWPKLRDLTELLLTGGADVNEKPDGTTLLHMTASMGLKDGVELLITHGADVNVKTANGMTPLHIVVESDSPTVEKYMEGIVEMLISNGANVNVTDNQGATPLWYANQKDHKRITELLRQHGAKEVAPGTSKRLHQAVAQGDMEQAKSLILKGADVNLKDKDGRIPLFAAARSGQKALVQLMLAKGAEVNMRDKGGWRPLDEAVNGGHKEVAELLIAAGANVNGQGEAGYTPLHTACYRGHREVVEILVAKGANLQIKNQLGQTSLDVAIHYERSDIVDLLRKHGAKE